MALARTDRERQLMELRKITQSKSASQLYALLDDVLEILAEHERKLRENTFEEID